MDVNKAVLYYDYFDDELELKYDNFKLVLKFRIFLLKTRLTPLK